jgi:putative acetyltransferase
MNQSALPGVGPSIRLALPDDAPAIALVLSESFAAYEPMYTPGGFAATTPSAGVIAQRFGEGPIWVAERQGVVMGTASAVPKGTALYVRSVAVHPGVRGQRIGQALMRQVEDYAVAEGFRRMFLSTTPFLTSAIRLYERLGFQRSGEGPQELYGTPLVTMVKELA